MYLKKKLCLFIFSFICILVETFIFSNSSSLTVRNIYLEINGKNIESEIKNLIMIKKGDKYDEERIRTSLDNLYKTGFVSNIRVEALEDQKWVDLYFIVQKKSIIRKIRFTGSKGLSTSKIKSGIISLREGEYFSKFKLEKTMEEIKGKLKENGFFNPEVSCKLETDKENSNINIIFDLNSGERARIGKIYLQGGLIRKDKEIMNYLNGKEGEYLFPFKFEYKLQKIKNVFIKEGFLNFWVESEYKINKESNIVDIYLKGNVGNKIIVDVKGAEVSSNLLSQLWREEIFEDWALNEGKVKIEDELKEKGYFFPEVKYSLRRENNEIYIEYKIKKGKRYKSIKIEFEGLSFIQKEMLTQLVKKRVAEENYFYPFWINGKIIEEYEKNILKFYRENGFFESDIDLKRVEKGKHLILIFNVKEGRRAIIGELKFNGLSFFKEDEILSLMDTKPGGAYVFDILQRDMERIKELYENKGFRETEIHLNLNGDDTFRKITIDVKEGKRYKINEIIFFGDMTTDKDLILKEIVIKKGDWADKSLILKSKVNLENLGIFSEVNVKEIKFEGNVISLVYEIKESKKNFFGFGLGYLERSGLRGTFEYSRINLFGKTWNFSSVFQASQREKRYLLSLEQPKILGMPAKGFWTGWKEKENRKSFDYDKIGITLMGVKNISDKNLLVIRTKLARTNLYNLEVASTSLDREYQPFYVSSFSISYIYEGRNDPFNPEEGYFFTIDGEKAFRVFGTTSDFLKGYFQFQRVKPIKYSFLSFFNARIGFITGDVPISERFFAGGSSFRGEKVDELGPKDPKTGNPVGGKYLTIFNFETVVPVFSTWKNLGLTVFFDWGNVFRNSKQFSLKSFQTAVGIGIRYVTPVGPLRFSIGQNLSKKFEGKNIVYLVNIGRDF
ncbi:MAG: POTRA domain-containing protein [Acidobacteriota bacterium]